MKSFKIDGIEFVQDFRAGELRGKSTKDSFILVKTDELLSRYKSLEAKNILEIGMFEGGGMVYFDKVFKPSKLLGVDIRDEIKPLEEYIEDKSYIKTYYNLSQDDDKLNNVLTNEFNRDIDLIVDDASHLYFLSKSTLEICWKHLKVGGKYVIEDWQWSLKDNYQKKDNAWYNQPSLANLIIELLLNTPLQPTIASLVIYKDMVIIEKGLDNGLDINDYKNSLRNKTFDLL